MTQRVKRVRAIAEEIMKIAMTVPPADATEQIRKLLLKKANELEPDKMAGMQPAPGLIMNVTKLTEVVNMGADTLTVDARDGRAIQILVLGEVCCSDTENKSFSGLSKLNALGFYGPEQKKE